MQATPGKEFNRMGLGSFRLLLALGVVVSHTKDYQFSSYPNAGLVAVLSFFFISGYLMIATYEVNYQDKSFGREARRFWLSRFLRVYPIYWLAVFFALIAIKIMRLEADYSFSATSLFQNFLLLGLNQEQLFKADSKYIGAAWTLDIELQFYLLVPLIMYVRKKSTAVFLALLVGLSVVALRYLFFPTGHKDVDQSLLPYFIFFASGMAAYHFRKNLAGVTNKILYGVAAGLVIAGFAMANPEILQWVLAFAAMVFSLAMIRIAPSSRDKKLGDLSYPVFVLHSPILLFQLGSHLPFVWSALLNITLSICVAQCIHSVVSPRIEMIRSRYKAREQDGGASIPNPGRLSRRSVPESKS